MRSRRLILASPSTDVPCVIRTFDADFRVLAYIAKGHSLVFEDTWLAIQQLGKSSSNLDYQNSPHWDTKTFIDIDGLVWKLYVDPCRRAYSSFSHYTAFTIFFGHTVQAIAMSNLIPPAIQRGICILLVPSAMKPPATAPASIPTKAKTRLFLFRFCLKGPKRAGSVEISCSILVKTTVGTSAKPSTRLPTICPALWKERSAIGNNCLHLMSLVIVFKLPLTVPACIIAAVTKMMSAWSRKEAVSVERRSGVRRREQRLKTKQPRQKEVMERKDLTQP